jgi:tRNA G10  N-methylase Trm11
MMDFIIRFAQEHETFRTPELEALAQYHNIALEIVEYSDEVSIFYLSFAINLIALRVFFI